jgi:hypothetical protein
MLAARATVLTLSPGSRAVRDTTRASIKAVKAAAVCTRNGMACRSCGEREMATNRSPIRVPATSAL